jgi:hypothetical protein
MKKSNNNIEEKLTWLNTQKSEDCIEYIRLKVTARRAGEINFDTLILL